VVEASSRPAARALAAAEAGMAVPATRAAAATVRMACGEVAAATMGAASRAAAAAGRAAAAAAGSILRAELAPEAVTKGREGGRAAPVHVGAVAVAASTHADQ